MSLLQCKLGTLSLKNPVTVASGTFGSGKEFMPFYDVGQLGGIMVKGTTLEKRLGNKPQRLVETCGGVINAIGLANPGVDYFITNILPEIKEYGSEIIVNISGSSIEDYGHMAEKLSIEGVSALEVNISCPNVKDGGIAFGTCPDMAGAVTAMVKKNTDKPVILKLSPNVTDIKIMAQSVEDNGADIISLINTLIGMAIDVKTKKPIITNVVGGYSGPPIKPVALRMVYEIYPVVNIPIIGMGGIMNTKDALEFMMAGATAISVGAANFVDPFIPLNIIDGINKYCKDEGLFHYSEIIGIAHQ
ncbi:dihydroorotate dehydrogenase [endosymbiont 'TC1' of Trimyema compressum]|uniref:dihydroorotate dehydrogenase n=1 Tax=endosymbiont 'TC1' of Trimyema compressum TaxID=243899 RepID=UPI0007F0C91F|nr:dihydroorotate dehydrogenase [endosymbiont 'TC1' of Trimyema compressum]AMP20199.1 dihydroorotate dehydrogenase [endosymbiont 'TC1' of Trimyema compressum]